MQNNKRQAFTLVELLVVIAIIGILATLSAVGANAAIRAARRASIAVNMNSVVMALENYRSVHGEYPPDLTDTTAVARHIKKRWPRFSYKGSIHDILENFYNGSKGLRLETGETVVLEDHGGPDSADPNARKLASLTFWLGGFPDADGTFLGFSADPAAPFGKFSDGSINNDGEKSEAIAPIQTFEQGSAFMDMTVGQNVFVVDYKSKKMVPVLAFKTGTEVYPLAYFRGSSLGGTNAYGDGTNPEQLHFDDFDEPGWSELGCIAPYAEMGTSAANATWYEPKKYQLIHPGLDGNFGDDSDGGFRSIGNDQYKQADLDNISNIAGFDEIETLIP